MYGSPYRDFKKVTLPLYEAISTMVNCGGKRKHNFVAVSRGGKQSQWDSPQTAAPADNGDAANN